MKARQFAVWYLSRRDYFSNELREKLIRKNFHKEEIDAILLELEKKGYLNDEKLALKRAEQYQSKGYGKRYIQQKLEHISGKKFKNLTPKIDLKKVAKLLEKYSLEDPKEKRRALGFLYRRGFSYEEVQSLFREDWQ